MEHWNETHFTGIEIAYAFTQLLAGSSSTRGAAGDAEFFRRGDTQSLGKLLVSTARTLESRVGRLQFHCPKHEDGIPRCQLKSAIGGLQAIGEGLQGEKQESEADDHHWLIIGELILTIASLLEHIEIRQNDPRGAEASRPDHYPHGRAGTGRDHFAGQ